MCRKFADEELAPNAGTWDKKHVFPQQAVEHLVCIHCIPDILPQYVHSVLTTCLATHLRLSWV
jgi:hypothetical protein